MGKDWDDPGGKEAFQAQVKQWGMALLPLLYPGAPVFMFAGTRMWHRIAAGMEDAGFHLWDTLMWIHGQGFPKAQDISKLIDAAGDFEREKLGIVKGRGSNSGEGRYNWNSSKDAVDRTHYMATRPSEHSAPWAGHKTLQLKPAWEPILAFRAPDEGKTYAELALEYGSGALNVEGARIGTTTVGRYPANLVLDEESGAILDKQTGNIETKHIETPSDCGGNTWGGTFQTNRGPRGYTDNGGASRFFYCAKASRGEREIGLDNFEIIIVEWLSWENEVQQARLQVDTGQLRPKVIAVSGTQNSDVIAWSMMLFGSDTKAPSLLENKSIIVTKTNFTMQSKTLNYLLHLITNAGIVAALKEMENSGNPVENAEYHTPSLVITNEKTESLLGVGIAASMRQLKIRGNAGPRCDHPTVKPIALNLWLAKLLLPPPLGVPRRLLVPFSGVSSEMIGALAAGWDEVVGVEQSAEYVKLALLRLEHWERNGYQIETAAVREKTTEGQSALGEWLE